MIERVRAPAKVNLRLRVGGREPDGYHRIDTVFCALELADELTVEVEPAEGGEGTPRPGTELRLEVDGPDLGPAEQNLAVHAARGFLERAGLQHSVAIRLRKRIPAAAGLGGGSSDAAGVLRVLARMLPDAAPPAALDDLARSLGADVPFFLRGGVLARGTGRGDVLEPGQALPSAPVVLALPPFGIATAAAYRWLDEDRGADAEASREDPRASIPRSWSEAARDAVNDFEAPVFRRHPGLAELRDLLRQGGAEIALLSGSGSTVFGVFPDDGAADGAVALLRARAPHVELLRTRTAAR